MGCRRVIVFFTNPIFSKAPYNTARKSGPLLPNSISNLGSGLHKMGANSKIVLFRSSSSNPGSKMDAREGVERGYPRAPSGWILEGKRDDVNSVHAVRTPL